jgi:hypothetical protein
MSAASLFQVATSRYTPVPTYFVCKCSSWLLILNLSCRVAMISTAVSKERPAQPLYCLPCQKTTANRSFVRQIHPVKLLMPFFGGVTKVVVCNAMARHKASLHLWLQESLVFDLPFSKESVQNFLQNTIQIFAATRPDGNV